MDFKKGTEPLFSLLAEIIELKYSRKHQEDSTMFEKKNKK